MSNISVRKKHSYSSIPDSVLEHPSLSVGTRLVLGWMLGKPNNWEIRVGHMLHVLSIGEKAWRKIKGELIEFGFFSQAKLKGESGKFEWVQEVNDDPLTIISNEPIAHIHDKNHTAFGRHGYGMDAESRINNNIYNNTTSPSPLPNPYPLSARESDSDVSENLDFSNLRELQKIINRQPSLQTKLQSQAQSDALEASLRLGELSGNKVKIPSKVLAFLKTKTPKELAEWGEAVRRERKQKQRIANSEVVSSKIKIDHAASARGKKMIEALRMERANHDLVSKPVLIEQVK